MLTRQFLVKESYPHDSVPLELFVSIMSEMELGRSFYMFCAGVLEVASFTLTVYKEEAKARLMAGLFTECQLRFI